jgi:hypothetical protein
MFRKNRLRIPLLLKDMQLARLEAPSAVHGNPNRVEDSLLMA